MTWQCGAESITKSVHDLCAELGMSGECIFSETPEQLRADGYHGNAAVPEVTLSYTHDNGTCAETGEALEYPSLPHKLLPDFKRLVTTRSMPPLHAMTLALMDTITAAEAAAKQADASFESPVWDREKSMKDWGLCALKAGGRASAVVRGYELLADLYEAARLVAASRQGALELAMMYLDMSAVLGPAAAEEWPWVLRQLPGYWRKTAERLQALQRLWDASRPHLHRTAHLRQVRCFARVHAGKHATELSSHCGVIRFRMRT